MDHPARSELIPDIQLAPMEGVLDWVLRELLSEVGGIDRMVTEFVRVTDQLLPASVFRKYAPELDQEGKTRRGTPVFVQLLGGKPGPMAENANRVAELGALGIDLNFGCPAKTVNRHDGGAALLQAPERLYEITKAVRASVPQPIPVTAKVRLGFAHKEFHREIAQAVEEAGASHIVVHARTKLEMYTRPAHWNYIASMAQGRKIPFLANGDIWSTEDFQNATQAAGVSRVALGRGLVRNPRLAHEIRQSQATGQYCLPDFSAGDFLNNFYVRSADYRGENYAVRRVKQLLRYWSETDLFWKMWFDRVKILTQSQEIEALISQIRRELEWRTCNSTQNPIAPIACAPKIFSIAKA